MKTLILLLLLSLSSTWSEAQNQTTPSDDGQELLDTFFDLYKNKGYVVALKYTMSTNKWIPPAGVEMDNIIVKLEKEIKNMGDYQGFEELRRKTLGSRLVYVSYLVYYQRDPVRFTFALYKNGTSWEISDFQYDFTFDKEVAESMKLQAAGDGGKYR